MPVAGGGHSLEAGASVAVAKVSAWVAVDWGTSNVRAWGMAADGSTTFTSASGRGMGRLSAEEYPAVLADLLRAGPERTGGPVEVLICGMAGAKQGWSEAPYLDLPADLGGLYFGAVPAAAGPDFSVRILPGVCKKQPGAEDVMRGEETQLLGLAALRPGFSGSVCMPGTHSKWVRLEARRIVDFSTAMTGELYEAIGAHTVVRHSLAGEQRGSATEDGIAAGLAAGLEQPQMLSSLLFRTRAAALLSGRGPDWCAGYLSGLLVGAEIGGRRQLIGAGPVAVMGSSRLCSLYSACLRQVGVETETIDATEATLAGLAAARDQART